MLRPAGTSLRAILNGLNERLAISMMIAVFIPLMLVLQTNSAVDFGQHIPLARVYVVLGLSLLVIVPTTFWMVWIGRSMRNHQLGHNAEVLVAEHMQVLARAGCYLFHDLQPTKTWNIDHIIVAPDSVLVVETKARRMRGVAAGASNGDGGQQAHEVIFDGKALHFPSWTDTHGLAQAERNAAWVRKYLAEALAEPVKVEAVLTLPGWMVHRRGRGNVQVINPKEFAALVRMRGAHHIPPEKQKRMKQVAWALDQKCRNVEF